MNIYIKKEIDEDIKNNAADVYQLQTEELYNVTDVLCEGPIEGMCDKFGNTLNYFYPGFIDLDMHGGNPILQYGLYLNDVSVRDKQSKLLNFANVSFSIDTGTENNLLPDSPAAVYSYKQRLYDLNNSYSLFKLPDKMEASNIKDFNVTLDQTMTNDQKNILNDIMYNERVFNHRIKNKYVTNAVIGLNIDNSYYIGGGGVYVENIQFAVVVTNLTLSTRNYFAKSFCTAVKGASSQIYINIDFDENEKNKDYDFLISVFPVTRRYDAKETHHFREISLGFITEKVVYNFNYPFSVVAKTKVSAKHFNGVPVRSFDCKLLKIKVPDNYDGEAREYIGDWSGKFSPFLKWTDDPAWIFYDLCVNKRYGLTKGVLTDNDINKWQMLKISKYCNELVKTNVVSKYQPRAFSYNNSTTDSSNSSFNTVTISTTATIEDLNKEYPIGKTIYFYDIVDNSSNKISTCYKKTILYVSTTGTVATIKLCDDFGPRKFFEKNDFAGILTDLSYLINPVIPNTLKQPADATEQIAPFSSNSQDSIKEFLCKCFGKKASSNLTSPSIGSEASSAVQYYSNKKIMDFGSSVTSVTGTCAVQHDGFLPLLEPRFSCNAIINNDSEGLKVLSDLSSVFRGIFYFQNGLLSITSDVLSSVSYVFSNSNVKDGLFSYATPTFSTIFTSAKVTYSDASDNFKDKIVLVEDLDMIRKYGIIEKEIIGFGATSKSQAQRIGKWFLTTNKLESQMLSFGAGIEASSVKPGDIIRISDQFKDSNLTSGKVTGRSSSSYSITIDREISDLFAGKEIRIFYNSKSTDQASVSSDQGGELAFTISRVDNLNLTVYIDSSASGFSASNFALISTGATFTAYLNQSYENNDLYRIVSIVENNVNEYSIACTKYSVEKYSIIENDEYVDAYQNVPKQIIFGNQSKIIPAVLTIPASSYLTISNYAYSDVVASSSSFDYSFFIEEESLQLDFITKKYKGMQINTANLFSDPVFSNKNIYGVLCVLTRNSKVLKFKINKNDPPKSINICLGSNMINETSTDTNNSSGTTFYTLDIYVYDQKDQLFNV